MTRKKIQKKEQKRASGSCAPLQNALISCEGAGKTNAFRREKIARRLGSCDRNILEYERSNSNINTRVGALFVIITLQIADCGKLIWSLRLASDALADPQRPRAETIFFQPLDERR